MPVFESLYGGQFTLPTFHFTTIRTPWKFLKNQTLKRLKVTLNKNKKQNSCNLTLHVSTEMEQNPTQDAGNLLKGKKTRQILSNDI